VSAVAVHHVVSGPADAPVLVLSHALGLTSAMWDLQVPALERRFRVVRYDLRGHGRSPVPPGPYAIADMGADLVLLLDRLGVARAHLCGLSLGGMVSLWVASHHPERVARMVVCCTAAQLGPAKGWAEHAKAARAHGVSALVEPSVALWFTPALLATHPERVAATRAAAEATPAEGFAASCEAIAALDLRADLPSIVAPTLAIAGAQDPATPAAHLQRIVDAIPGARLAVVEGAAHFANLEQPERVTELIEQHLVGDDRPGDLAAREAGMRVRREVLGDAHVDRAIARTTPLTAPFQDFITRVVWGEIWQRGELDRRTRSCITLAVLATLRADDELALHVRGALRNGLTAAEISEVLLHTTAYAGAPAGNHAMAVAQRVLAEVAAEDQSASSKGKPT
jgi:3-oxoadipate enol-lactonase / 4-carboxymuconolactone decarboxylase